MGKASTIVEIRRPLGNIGGTVHSVRSGEERRREANLAAAERSASHRARQEALREEEQRRRTFELEALPHIEALYNFAVRMTFDPAEAEDLVQETYLKAYRFFDKFERGTNCKAWLFRIMKNSYINRYRRIQKRPQTVDFNAVEEFVQSLAVERGRAGDAGDALFDNILDDEVTIAIERLPGDFRTVIILCDIEGFTYEEIAEFADCPVGTVRSRLHRGRRLLREALAGYAATRGYCAPDDGDSV